MSDSDAVSSITPHDALTGQTIVKPNCFGMRLKGSLSASVKDYCQACLVITMFCPPSITTVNHHLTHPPTHKRIPPSVFSFSDDGEDGGEISDRESLGKKKRGPKKKKETKKKDKEGKTTKARKRKKIVCRSI